MTSTIRRLSDPSRLEAGEGAPLVLLHGVGMQAAAWSPQLEALAPHARVIALDLPGHGGAGKLRDGAELAEYVGWLASALDALGLKRVSLAGHSMGALIAGGFAVEHGPRVARVALLNGVFNRDVAAREAVIARAALIASGVFDLETPLARWFAAKDADARAQVAGWLGAVDRQGYATAYSAFARGDATYAARLSEISCPLLALTGAEDPNSTPAMSRAMAEAAPKGRAIVVNGERHMVNLTAPVKVNEALLDWMEAT